MRCSPFRKASLTFRVMFQCSQMWQAPSLRLASFFYLSATLIVLDSSTNFFLTWRFSCEHSSTIFFSFRFSRVLSLERRFNRSLSCKASSHNRVKRSLPWSDSTISFFSNLSRPRKSHGNPGQENRKALWGDTPSKPRRGRNGFREIFPRVGGCCRSVRQRIRLRHWGVVLGHGEDSLKFKECVLVITPGEHLLSASQVLPHFVPGRDYFRQLPLRRRAA